MAGSVTSVTCPPAGTPTLLDVPTVFVLPGSLLAFNEILGATGFQDAILSEVRQTAVVNPGAVDYPVTYQVPAQKVALGMSGAAGEFSRHSAAILIQGVANYGVPGPEGNLVVSAGPLPVTRDFLINRLVLSSHEILSNFTALITNGLPFTVEVSISVTWLLVDEALWQNVYRPIYRQALPVILDRLAAAAAAVSTTEGVGVS